MTTGNGRWVSNLQNRVQQDKRPRHECAAKLLSAHPFWRHAPSSPACRCADNHAHGLVFLRAVTPGCARQRWTWQMSNYDDEAFHSKVRRPKMRVRFVSRILKASAKADHRIGQRLSPRARPGAKLGRGRVAARLAGQQYKYAGGHTNADSSRRLSIERPTVPTVPVDTNSVSLYFSVR